MICSPDRNYSVIFLPGSRHPIRIRRRWWCSAAVLLLNLRRLAQTGDAAAGDEAHRKPAGVIDLGQGLDGVEQRVTLIGVTGLGMGHMVVVIEHGRVDLGSSPGSHRKGRWVFDHGKHESDLDGLRVVG